MALRVAGESELVKPAIRRTLEAQSWTAPDGQQRVNPNLAELYRRRAYRLAYGQGEQVFHGG
jgi:hypothetical protein